MDECFCSMLWALLDRSPVGHSIPSESLTVDEHYVFMDEKASWDLIGGYGNSFLNPIVGWGNHPENPREDETISNFPCLWMRIFPTGNLMVDVEIPFWSLLVDEETLLKTHGWMKQAVIFHVYGWEYFRHGPNGGWENPSLDPTGGLDDPSLSSHW